MPGATEPPYGGWMDDVATALAEATRSGGLESAVEKVVVHRGEITFFVRREHLAAVAQLLRDDETLRFELCSGVSGVHYPDDIGRELHAVYHLLSMTHNRRIRVEVTAPTPTRTSPAWSRPTPPPTGTSARPSTSSASSSTATPRSPASRCPTTGPATPSARTTRSAASRSSTRAAPSRRPTSGGRTR